MKAEKRKKLSKAYTFSGLATAALVIPGIFFLAWGFVCLVSTDFKPAVLRLLVGIGLIVLGNIYATEALKNIKRIEREL